MSWTTHATIGSFGEPTQTQTAGVSSQTYSLTGSAVPIGSGPILVLDVGEGWKTFQPIPVTVEQIDGAVVASFADAGIHASGDDVGDALSALLSLTRDMYEFLTETEERLGTGPRKQLLTLRSYVQPDNAHEGPRREDRT